MTEDLEMVQQSQLQRDEQYYNMGYREAFQSAMERKDSEANKIGLQLGYTLMDPNAKLEGYRWTARALELDDRNLECQANLIGEVLERIHLETKTLEESSEIRRVLSEACAFIKTTKPQETMCSDSINKIPKKTSLKECMDKLEIWACKLYSF